MTEQIPNEDQIKKLNEIVNVRLAPSKTHGVGLFAIRDIEVGKRLWGNVYPQFFDLPYSEFDKLLPEVKQLILERWPGVASNMSVLGGARFAYPDTLLQAYINHCDSPNYNPDLDLTLRDIKKGEEILENYKLIDGWEVANSWLKVVDKPIIKRKTKSVV